MRQLGGGWRHELRDPLGPLSVRLLEARDFEEAAKRYALEVLGLLDERPASASEVKAGERTRPG